MSVKRTGQLGFGELGASRRRGSDALDQVARLVDWGRFEAALSGLRSDGPGRSGYRPLLMFKALLLQAWYGLSDAELEFRLGDSLAFGRFVGLSLEDDVPDHSTICRFRNELIAARLLEKLFAELDRQLETSGLVLKQGTMLDATLIEAATGRPGRGKEAEALDPDAAFVKRQGKPGSTYGYKAHVAVDQGSGLIRAVITTPANVNDTTPADALIQGDEGAVYADKAYDTHARRAALAGKGIKPRIMRRPSQYHGLTPRQQLYNDLISRRRAAVETTFATMKRRMGLARTRYVGLAKVTAQMLMAAMAFNLRKLAVMAT